jgi:hypothetical protein
VGIFDAISELGAAIFEDLRDLQGSNYKCPEGGDHIWIDDREDEKPADIKSYQGTGNKVCRKCGKVW